MWTKCQVCYIFVIYLMYCATHRTLGQTSESNTTNVVTSSLMSSLTTGLSPLTVPDVSSSKVTVGTSVKAPAIPTTGAVLNRDQMQKDEIRCYIYNELSTVACSNTVAGETSENDDLGKGCSKLEGYKSLVTVLGCTFADYNLLHSVICTWDGTQRCTDYELMQRNKITEYELTLKQSCRSSLNETVKAEKPHDYCEHLSKNKDNLACSSSELANLEKIVCCVGIECFEDMSIRENQVKQAIRKLSTPCSKTMIVALKELSETPEKACVTLEMTKPALLGGRVCKEDDYSSLQKVVCSSGTKNTPTQGTTTPDPFPNEKEQRERIQEVIQGGLGKTCKEFMVGQAASQISDPLAKTCKTFLGNYGFIVVGGQCTDEEYRKLKVVVCGEAGTAITNMVLLIISFLLVFLNNNYTN